MTEPGNYGSAIINKPLSAFFVPGAGIYSPTAACIAINAPGATDTISIHGLNCIMDGLAKDGIRFLAGFKLRLENTVVRGTTGTTCGLRFARTSGQTQLEVKNSSFSDNGTALGVAGGICLTPAVDSTVSADISSTSLQNNRQGLTSAATGAANTNIVMDNSKVSANGTGFSIQGAATVCVRSTNIHSNSIALTGGVRDGGNNLLWGNGLGSFSGTCP